MENSEDYNDFSTNVNDYDEDEFNGDGQSYYYPTEFDPEGRFDRDEYNSNQIQTPPPEAPPRDLQRRLPLPEIQTPPQRAETPSIPMELFPKPNYDLNIPQQSSTDIRLISEIREIGTIVRDEINQSKIHKRKKKQGKLQRRLLDIDGSNLLSPFGEISTNPKIGAVAGNDFGVPESLKNKLGALRQNINIMTSAEKAQIQEEVMNALNTPLPKITYKEPIHVPTEKDLRKISQMPEYPQGLRQSAKELLRYYPGSTTVIDDYPDDVAGKALPNTNVMMYALAMNGLAMINGREALLVKTALTFGSAITRAYDEALDRFKKERALWQKSNMKQRQGPNSMFFSSTKPLDLYFPSKK